MKRNPQEAVSWGWEGKEENEWDYKRARGNFWALMGMFLFLTVGTVSQMSTVSKCIELCTLNVCTDCGPNTQNKTIKQTNKTTTPSTKTFKWERKIFWSTGNLNTALFNDRPVRQSLLTGNTSLSKGLLFSIHVTVLLDLKMRQWLLDLN